MDVIEQKENDSQVFAINNHYSDIAFKRDETDYQYFFLDFYAAVFQAQRFVYKKKYRLSTDDQVSYYFEALFLLSIQFILCTALLMSGDITPLNNTRFDVQVASFFCMCLLHLPCCAIVRNGMAMCKHVAYHPEEYTNPTAIFMFGFLVVVANILCEITNAFALLSKKKVTDVINKFVAFKIMI